MVDKAIISIRVSDKEKADIKALADTYNMNLTDYIKHKALYDVTKNSDKTIIMDRTNKEIDELVIIRTELDFKNKKYDSLLTELKMKDSQIAKADKELSKADSEIATKNEQIKELHRLLDQQQQLQLTSNQNIKEIQKSLDYQTEKNSKKWFQFWKE